jgi:hypothetical protein
MIPLFIAFTLVSSSATAGGIEIIVGAGCGRYLGEEPPGGSPGSVCFSDEKPVASLSVTYVSHLNGHRADPTKKFVFPRRDWVDAVKLRVFNRADGIEVPVVPRVISRDFANPASRDLPRDGKFFVLKDREGVNARIELTGMTPGDYEIEAEIPGVSSTDHRERFTIRRGDEDLPTTKLFYRYRADKASGDFRAYERILRELMAKYEPNNPGPLVQIADWSVDKVPPEETVRFYREARTMVEANWRAELAKNPNVPEFTKKRIEEAIERLTVFERVLPYYRTHKDELRFGGAVVEGKQVYAWFPRKGGLMIDTIDPANPGRRNGPRQR